MRGLTKKEKKKEKKELNWELIKVMFMKFIMNFFLIYNIALPVEKSYKEADCTMQLTDNGVLHVVHDFLSHIPNN